MGPPVTAEEREQALVDALRRVRDMTSDDDRRAGRVAREALQRHELELALTAARAAAR